ncbi:hypothetical protein AVEN_207950-1 [Araneus ventricosus]|uniref:Uncharacterized protein n=1 Tax=Araneus ventricosus TaxID=182803 RepID=A0A4Y2FRR6_ARAVE|nr:hypothetical protein AVEN_207950-1 [Araneus ventricosus]
MTHEPAPPLQTFMPHQREKIWPRRLHGGYSMESGFEPGTYRLNAAPCPCAVAAPQQNGFYNNSYGRAATAPVPNAIAATEPTGWRWDGPKAETLPAWSLKNVKD